MGQDKNMTAHALLCFPMCLHEGSFSSTTRVTTCVRCLFYPQGAANMGVRAIKRGGGRCCPIRIHYTHLLNIGDHESGLINGSGLRQLQNGTRQTGAFRILLIGILEPPYWGSSQDLNRVRQSAGITNKEFLASIHCDQFLFRDQLARTQEGHFEAYKTWF